MKNAREKAIEWWNKLPIIEKSLLAQKYSDALFGRGYVSLTGREIEAIWLDEIGLAEIDNKIYTQPVKGCTEKSIDMKTETEQKFSWFPEDGTCPDVFDSIEDAIKDAQERYDKGSEPFEDGDEYVPPVINVGTVRYFDFKDATEKIVDGIEDDIYEQMADFNFGCDFESECYVSRKDKEAFKKEAIEALLPIVDKYVFVNPEWVCTPTKKYDLKNKKWMIV